MANPVAFSVIGSAWRAEFFLRIAQAVPDQLAVAGVLAQTLSPITYGFPQEVLAQANLQLGLSRVSPNTLYAESMVALLNPEVRSLGILLTSQMDGAVMGAPLPFGQSVLLIWPEITGLIAITILLFALAYVLFQRQEIRA